MKKYSEEAKRVAAETVQMFGGNTFDALVDTIELYWEAQREKKRLLQQTPCSTSVPPSLKDQLTFNSSIQELLAKVHDDVEGRYDLTAEDLFDVQSVLAACQ